MKRKSPFSIVKSRYITEKSTTLQGLEGSTSNRCTARCKAPKAVFIVDQRANKREVEQAVEEIYKEKNVKVAKVNTINVNPKPRRVRGRSGFKAGFKKAVVTFEPGDQIDEV